MKFDNKTIFISGANRGIGKAIVEAFLKQPVKKIYAAARNVKDLPKFADPRVVPITLDITNLEQVKKAAAQANDVDVLINNAGALSHAGFITGEPGMLKHDMDVNYFGTINMVQSFVPVIKRKGGGAIANLASIVSFASIPSVGGYSASKAALFSATQAMRTELKADHILVFGIFPGPIDTDMAKDFDFDKASPQETAENIIKGMAANQEDIFPDPMAVQIGHLWATNPKALESQFATMG